MFYNCMDPKTSAFLFKYDAILELPSNLGWFRFVLKFQDQLWLTNKDNCYNVLFQEIFMYLT